MDAYLRWVLIQGWAFNRINTVWCVILELVPRLRGKHSCSPTNKQDSGTFKVFFRKFLTSTLVVIFIWESPPRDTMLFEGVCKWGGICKFDSMIGHYEMKCTPDEITSDFENLKNLRVCDKLYSSLYPRGLLKITQFCPARYSEDNTSIVTCSQCNNTFCLTGDVPCKKHNITIFNNLFSVTEIYDSKTYFYNDTYMHRSL